MLIVVPTREGRVTYLKHALGAAVLGGPAGEIALLFHNFVLSQEALSRKPKASACRVYGMGTNLNAFYRK